MDFRSDNTATACPEILAALAAANTGPAAGYGEDEWTKRVEARFCELFETDVAVFLTATGTAANAIGIAALTPPWGGVLCHRDAHIETAESGAPEFYSSGAKLMVLDGAHAKIAPDTLEQAFAVNHRGVHTIPPRVLSITQSTERGAVYKPDEIAALSAIARRHDVSLHMDGARFANAVAHLGCTPAEITHRGGVDVLSFGATKNGALAAEAIVVFDRDRVGDIARLRKRGGHLLSKHRYLAAQMLAYLEDDLWLRNARHANALAQRIAAAAGGWLAGPCEANQVIVRAGVENLEKLRAAGAVFYDWGAASSGEARIVLRWDHDDAEVDRFADLVRSLRT